MNNKEKMGYYLETEYINLINRDIWPEKLVIHAVYYYKDIKYDIDEKLILSNIIPDLNNIVLGIECNGYLPNEVETGPMSRFSAS